MEIIDSQYHEPAPRIEWAYGEESRVDLGVELTLAQMDSVGVDIAVLTSTRPEYLDRALALHPGRFVGIQEWDPDSPDLEDLMAGTLDRPDIIGVRLLLGWPPENIDRLRAGGYDRFFSAARRHDVPVTLFCAGALDALPAVAEKFPDLTLVLDHFGHKQPPLQEREGPLFRRLDDLLSLATYPNVSVKFSGGPTLSAQPYPFLDLWPSLSQIIDAYGAGRLMWGTDITRVNGLLRTPAMADSDFRVEGDYPGKHTYAEALHFLLDSPQLSLDEKELIFGGALRKIFRWPRNAGR